MACTGWRGVPDRVEHMLDNPPGDPGWCAREVWHALGGNLPSPCPPAWGCANANELYDKVTASDRWFTSTPIPDGAVIVWRYGNNGHAALAWKGGICTTDPEGQSGGTGEYNGVRFDVGGADAGPFVTAHVYRSKCGYGQTDSDTVSELQERINRVSLDGGVELDVTGNYDDATDREVRLWQEQVCGDKPDPAGKSYLGPAQFAQAFPAVVYTRHDDGDPVIAGGDSGTDPDTEPAPPTTVKLPLGIEYYYSGKPDGTFTFGSTYKPLDVDEWAPPEDGYTLALLYLNVDGPGGEFRSRIVRDPDDGTAYQTHYPRSGDNYLTTHVWFEAAEGGRAVWPEVATMDGETLTAGTRYWKVLYIPEAAVLDVGGIVGTYRVARQWLPRAAVIVLVAALLAQLARRRR